MVPPANCLNLIMVFGFAGSPDQGAIMSPISHKIMTRQSFEVSNPTGHASRRPRRRTSCAALFALALLAACVACSRPVIKQYQKDGVQFSYYSNWKIVKDAPIAGKPDVRSIQIEGPSNALISLICEPPASKQSLEQFADAVATRRGAAIEAKLSVGGIQTAQVSKGTSNPTTGKVAGRDR